MKDSYKSYTKNYISVEGGVKKRKNKPFEAFPLENYLDKSLEDPWE